MSKINVLEPNIYNLIAAGEVVERPASVIKELVENSIDAKAKNITIEIKDGGTTFMQVSDDGIGIEEDDVKKAFLPHATSKIAKVDDLNTILTLGFRGEALASIASVSKVKMITKTEGSELGTSLTIEGGNFGVVEKIGANRGTTITVKDLFYCVPARAKFLKRNKTEEQEITNIISRTILANPSVKFNYIVDGKKMISSTGTNEKEAMYSVYGKTSISETLEVSLTKNNYKIYGFIGKPTYSKSNRTYQTLIVNGRYVINTTVQTAVTNAFGDFLMKRQFPFYILYLTLPIDEIDINVHPNKLDVKFLNSGMVYSTVFEAVSRALNDMDYIKEINENEQTKFLNFQSTSSGEKIDKAGVNLNPFSQDFENLNISEKDKVANLIIDSIISSDEKDNLKDNFGLGSKLLERLNQKVGLDKTTAFNPEDYDIKNDNILTYDIDYSGETSQDGKKFFKNDLKFAQKVGANIFSLNECDIDMKNDDRIARIKALQEDFAEDNIKTVGKLFNTYLIIEWGENMYLIDQHAAHERIRYEKLKTQYEKGEIAVQPMLMPYVLSLNPEDNQILQSNIDAIRSVGFEIEEFGEQTYKISAVPSIVSDIDFNKFFSMFLEEKLNKKKLTQAELVKDHLIQLSCKSAVKGGDDLSRSEIFNLLHEIGSNNFILFCPHGRPVVVRIRKSEIERWFKRIV